MKNETTHTNLLMTKEKILYMIILLSYGFCLYLPSVLSLLSKKMGNFGFIEIFFETIFSIIIIVNIDLIILVKENNAKKIKRAAIILAVIYFFINISYIVFQKQLIHNYSSQIFLERNILYFIFNIKNILLIYLITILFLIFSKKELIKNIVNVIFIPIFLEIAVFSLTKPSIKTNIFFNSTGVFVILMIVLYLSIASLLRIVKTTASKKEMLISKVLLFVLAVFILSYINPFKYAGAWEYKDNRGKTSFVFLLRPDGTLEIPSAYKNTSIKYSINYFQIPNQITFKDSAKGYDSLSFLRSMRGGYYYDYDTKSTDVTVLALNNRMYLSNNIVVKNGVINLSITDILSTITDNYKKYKKRELINAVLSNNYNKCEKLINDLNRKEIKNREKEMRYLFREYIEENIVTYTDDNEYNAMHYALISKNEKMIKLFLDNKIPLYTKDNINKYLFELPVSKKMKEYIINNLIYRENKALFSVLNEYRYKNRELINKLIENNISMNIEDLKGNDLVSTLIKNYGFKEKDMETLELIFKNGFDTSKTNIKNENALYYAIAENDIPLTKYLLSKGYTISLLESKQASPLFMIFQSIKKRKEMLNFLLENNAKLDTKNKEQQIPIFNMFKSYDLTLDDFIYAMDVYKSHNVPYNQMDSKGRNIISYFAERFGKNSKENQEKINEIYSRLLKELYSKSAEEIAQNNKKYSLERKEIPANKFKATYSNGETEFVDNVIINANSKISAHWVGYLEYDRDMIKNLEMSISWSSVVITIDDTTVFKQNQYNESYIPYFFNKGIHKIDINFVCGWHTTEFFLKIKDVEKEYSFKELKEIIKPDKYSIYYVGTYESEDKFNQITLKLQEDNNPVVLILGSYSPIWWQIKNKNHNVKYVLFNSSENGTFLDVENSDGVKIFKVKGIPYIYSLKEESKLEQIKPQLKDVFGEEIKSVFVSYRDKEVIVQ